MLHIDTTSYRDYKEVLNFLFGQGVPILQKSLFGLFIIIDMPRKFEEDIRRWVDFEEAVTIEETPLN